MTNCSVGGSGCDNCSLVTGGGTPPHLLRYAVLHYYMVFVFGTVCNVVALSSIVTCNKTQTPVKVLLCSVFISTLLMCLVVMPFKAEVALSELWCDPSIMPRAVWIALNVFYSIIAGLEIFFITVLAFLRAVAVWSPQRHTLSLKEAAALVVIGCLFNAATNVMDISLWLEYVTEPSVVVALTILYSCLNFLLPILVTIACYLSMMLAVSFNSRRLVDSRHYPSDNRVVDQATRAMLAVFISNLLMALPHTLYHLIRNINQFVEPFSHTTYIVVHVIFFVHFVVDPFVFVWFNVNHRERVGAWLRVGLHRVRCCSPSTAVTLDSCPSTLTTTSSTDTPSALSLTTSPSTHTLTSTSSTVTDNCSLKQECSN